MKKCTMFVIFILCISLLCGCVDGGKKDAQVGNLESLHTMTNCAFNIQ